MTCCPHCGGRNGLYSNEQVSYQQYYTFVGEPNGYSEFRQIGSSARRILTPLYCIDCGKKITTAERLIWAGDDHDS